MNGNGIYDGSATDIRRVFGTPGDLPVVGNWNGIGGDKIGTYHNANGTWFLDTNGNFIWEGSPVDTKVSAFGGPGYLPVVGDWNGIGSDWIGYYSNGYWLLDTNRNGVWDDSVTDTVFGRFGRRATDIPVTGKWVY
jgi:hypothetical protein